MKFVDSHMHLWDLSQQMNSWVINSNNPQLIQNYLLKDYLEWVNDSTQLKGIITIEAADGSKSLEEVKWLADSLKVQINARILHRHIAYIDTTQNPELFTKQLELFKPFQMVAGFRDICAFSRITKYSPCNEDITLNKEKLTNLEENLALLKQNNYIYNCQMYPDQLLRILPLISKSEVSCIIDHCGLPLPDNLQQYLFWQQMLEESSQTEIYFKLSGLDINDNWMNQSKIVDTISSKISLDRLVYGSNFPLLQRDWLRELSQLIGINGYSETEIEQILLTNTINLFQL